MQVWQRLRWCNVAEQTRMRSKYGGLKYVPQSQVKAWERAGWHVDGPDSKTAPPVPGKQQVVKAPDDGGSGSPDGGKQDNTDGNQGNAGDGGGGGEKLPSPNGVNLWKPAKVEAFAVAHDITYEGDTKAAKAAIKAWLKAQA